MKPTMTIMVAVPRSGKSTYVEANKEGKTVLSADALRLEFYGDKGHMKGEKLVWNTFTERLEKAVEDKEDIIIDNTNVNLKSRNKLTKLAKENGYTLEAVVIETSRDTLLKRAKEHNFPKVVIYTMLKNFVMPTEEEGFDKITVAKGE